jgi:hypothetical protein
MDIYEREPLKIIQNQWFDHGLPVLWQRTVSKTNFQGFEINQNTMYFPLGTKSIEFFWNS